VTGRVISAAQPSRAPHGGDVIEELPNQLYPITTKGYAYHPQNEALLPWLE